MAFKLWLTHSFLTLAQQSGSSTLQRCSQEYSAPFSFSSQSNDVIPLRGWPPAQCCRGWIWSKIWSVPDAPVASFPCSLPPKELFCPLRQIVSRSHMLSFHDNISIYLNVFGMETCQKLAVCTKKFYFWIPPLLVFFHCIVNYHRLRPQSNTFC